MLKSMVARTLNKRLSMTKSMDQWTFNFVPMEMKILQVLKDRFHTEKFTEKLGLMGTFILHIT